MLNFGGSLAVTAAMCGFLFLYFRSQIRKVKDSQEILGDVRDEVNRLVVDLNQTTERNIGLIEDRISKLQKLIGEADKKMVLLNREGEKHDLTTRVYDHLKRSARTAGGFQGGGSAEHTSTDRSPDSGATDGTANRQDGSDEEHHGPGRSLRERVMSMSRQGFDARMIASRLGATLGEVELIISIGERKQ